MQGGEMSKTYVVRYEVKPETADENQRLVEQVFAELSATQPEGFRYATFRLEDGVNFIHVITYENDGDPLGSLAAFKKFQETVGERMVAPPQRGPVTVVGAYGFMSE
jgi:hypothetical protein